MLNSNLSTSISNVSSKISFINLSKFQSNYYLKSFEIKGFSYILNKYTEVYSMNVNFGTKKVTFNIVDTEGNEATMYLNCILS